MSGPEPRKALAAIQIVVLLVLGYAMLNVFSDSRNAEEEGTIVITDTTGEVHAFSFAGWRNLCCWLILFVT